MRTQAAVTLALTAVVVACSGGEVPSTPAPIEGSHPSGPTRGGQGLAGRGGDAGRIFLSGAAVVVQQATPDDPPPSPVTVTFDLGANPRTITGDVTLQGLILGDDGVSTATGLWVKPGATLRLGAVPGVANLAEAGVAGPARVDGAVQAAPSVSTSGRILSFHASGIHVGPQGSFDASGGPGWEAAELELRAGALLLEGSLLARGGNGAVDASGGEIRILRGHGPVTLSGLVDASGGRSTLVSARLGGGALDIMPDQDQRVDVHLAGVVRLAGGTSDLGSGGGAGGRVTAYAGGAEGVVVLSGTVDVSGGTGAAAGGAGGGVSLACDRAWVTGIVEAGGGDGTGGPGGPGGGLSLSGPVLVSGTLDLSGGDGLDGGAGGEFVVNPRTGDSRPIVLAGMASLRAEGGDGAEIGGAGGHVEIFAPAVRLDVPIALPGGYCTQSRYGGLGGMGGRLTVWSEEVSCLEASAEGGDATGYGGYGGVIRLEGTAELHVGGSLRVTGGTGESSSGRSGAVVLNALAQPLVDGVYTP